MFVGKALLALLSNIRHGWKGMLGTSTLAYYEQFKITDDKSFITLGPGVNIIKLFEYEKS
jgi:hypothetical protein